MEMAKQLAEADITTLPQQHQMHSYIGDQTPSIRLMMVVEACSPFGCQSDIPT
jgi:hypothetical protein